MPTGTFIHTRCANPECRREYRVKAEFEGKSATCKACGHRFPLIPEFTAAAKNSQPASTILQQRAEAPPPTSSSPVEWITLVFSRQSALHFPDKCVGCCANSAGERITLDYGNWELVEKGNAGKVGDIIGKGFGGMVGGIIGGAVTSSIMKPGWRIEKHKAVISSCPVCKGKLTNEQDEALANLNDIESAPLIETALIKKEHKGNQVLLSFANPKYATLLATSNQGRVFTSLEKSTRTAKVKEIRFWIIFAIVMIPVLIVLWLMMDKGIDFLTKGFK